MFRISRQLTALFFLILLTSEEAMSVCARAPRSSSSGDPAEDARIAAGTDCGPSVTVSASSHASPNLLRGKAHSTETTTTTTTETTETTHSHHSRSPFDTAVTSTSSTTTTTSSSSSSSHPSSSSSSHPSHPSSSYSSNPSLSSSGPSREDIRAATLSARDDTDPPLREVDAEEKDRRAELSGAFADKAEELGFHDQGREGVSWDTGAGGAAHPYARRDLRRALRDGDTRRAERDALKETLGRDEPGVMDPEEANYLRDTSPLSRRSLKLRSAALARRLEVVGDEISRGQGSIAAAAQRHLRSKIAAENEARVLEELGGASSSSSSPSVRKSPTAESALAAKRDALLERAVRLEASARRKRLEAVKLEGSVDDLSEQLEAQDKRVQALEKAMYEASQQRAGAGTGAGSDDPFLLAAEARADEHEAKLADLEAAQSRRRARVDGEEAATDLRNADAERAAAKLRREEAKGVSSKEATARASRDDENRLRAEEQDAAHAAGESLAEDRKEVQQYDAERRAEKTIAGDLRGKEQKLEVRAARAAVRAMRAFLLAKTAEGTLSSTEKVEREASAKAAMEKAKALADQLAAEKSEREEQEAAAAKRAAAEEENRDKTAGKMAKQRAKEAMEKMRELASAAMNALRLATSDRAGEAAKAAAAAAMRALTKSTISQEKSAHSASKGDLATVSKDYVEEKEYKLRMDTLEKAPGHQSMYPPLMAASIAAAAGALAMAKGQQARENAAQRAKDESMVNAADDMAAAQGKKEQAESAEAAGARSEVASKVAKAVATAALAEACDDSLKSAALDKIGLKAGFIDTIKGLLAGKASLAAAKNEAIARVTAGIRDKLAGRVRDLGEHRQRLEKRGEKNKDEEKDFLRRKIETEEKRLVHEEQWQEASKNERRAMGLALRDTRARIEALSAAHHARDAVEKLMRYLLAAHKFLAHAEHESALEEYEAAENSADAARLGDRARIAKAHAAAEAHRAEEERASAKGLSSRARRALEALNASRREETAAQRAKREALEAALRAHGGLAEASAARDALAQRIRDDTARARRLRDEARREEERARDLRKQARVFDDEVARLAEAAASKAMRKSRAGPGKGGAAERRAAGAGIDLARVARTLTADDFDAGVDENGDTPCEADRRAEARGRGAASAPSVHLDVRTVRDDDGDDDNDRDVHDNTRPIRK